MGKEKSVAISGESREKKGQNMRGKEYYVLKTLRHSPGGKLMKIGVISDTHGYLAPSIQKHFSDVDLILHAGDVGSLEVLMDLQKIAPLEAVYGNTDNYDVRRETEFKRIIKAGNLTIGLAHGGGSPIDIVERLRGIFKDDNVNIVVFGHTHSSFQKTVNGIFFFNPGYGRTSVGFIEILNGELISTDIEKV